MEIMPQNHTEKICETMLVCFYDFKDIVPKVL